MRNTIARSLRSMTSNLSPVAASKCGMSIAASGSVQRTSSRSPGAKDLKALRVLSAGSGHFSPDRSNLVMVMARQARMALSRLWLARLESRAWKSRLQLPREWSHYPVISMAVDAVSENRSPGRPLPGMVPAACAQPRDRQNCAPWTRGGVRDSRSHRSVCCAVSDPGRSRLADPGQWVISAYVLSFAALLLAAGSYADRYGRKRAILIGLAVFAVASGLCGLAKSALMLDLAPALQGVVRACW
jgi:Major Facilitator Superfamily